MKTKIIVALLFLANISANAQVRSVLFQSLKDEFTVPAGKTWIAINEPEDFPNWVFDNCFAFKEKDTVWVQVGSSKASGSITTPALEGLTGNARINVQFEDLKMRTLELCFIVMREI